MASYASLLESLNDGRVTSIPLKLIERDPKQPRRTFDRATLNDLAANIGAHGVKQPITVRPDGKRFVIDMGERRYRASEIAGLTEIPALLASSEVAVDALDETASFERRLEQLAENHHRDPLNAIDLARFLCQLRDDYGMSATAIAQELKDRGFRDMGRSYVTNTMRLMDLPEVHQKAIQTGALPAGHGKYLLQAPDSAEGQAALAEAMAMHAEDHDEGERLTTWELRQSVLSAWHAVSFKLEGYCSELGQVMVAEGHGYDAAYRLFDIAECEGCPKRKTLTIDGDVTEFCTDRQAFLEKQRAAVKAGPSGQSDGTASSTAKAKPITPKEREKALRGKVYEHLTDWLRGRLCARCAGNGPLLFQLFAWTAAGGSTVDEHWNEGQFIFGSMADWRMRQGEPMPEACGLGDPMLFRDVPEGSEWFDSDRLMRMLFERLDDARIWRWALAHGITLEGYRITDGYFECLDKAELLIMAKGLKLDVSASAKKDVLVQAITDGAPEGFLPDRVEDVFDTSKASHEAVIDKYRQAQAAPANEAQAA